MDKDYSNVCKEVLEILENSTDEIIEKVPIKIFDHLKSNIIDIETNIINFKDENWKDNLNEKTKLFIAAIYRDYLVSDEERKKLIEEEKNELVRIEKEKQEKFGVGNLFKNKENDKVKKNELTKIEKIPWYKKIFEKILTFFQRDK